MDQIIKICAWLWNNLVAFLSHTIGAVIILAIFTFLKALKDQQTIGYFWAHPLELFSPAIITVLFVAVVSLSLIVVRQRNTLGSFGVRLFSAHDSVESKKRDWSLLIKDLGAASAEKSQLWILGATGKETFSGAGSPLFDIVKNYEGEIKILLIRPKSFAFRHRCQGLRVSDGSYLDEILDSIDYCKELATKGRPITVKLYDSLPIWKMVLMSRVLWVQYYKEKKHVDDTPMYSFEFKGEGSTLFDGFRSVFHKRWNHDGSHLVDLATFVRSSWETHL